MRNLYTKSVMNISDHLKYVDFDLVSFLNGSSTIVGYLMPNPPF